MYTMTDPPLLLMVSSHVHAAHLKRQKNYMPPPHISLPSGVKWGEKVDTYSSLILLLGEAND